MKLSGSSSKIIRRSKWRVTLGLAGLVLGIYVGLPALLVQFLNLGLISQGRGRRNALALTFDDGPDPVGTPIVLKVLKHAGARATFFVVLQHAEAHPDLIAQMLAEGHEVEPHAVKHTHAWFRSPLGAFFDPIHATARLFALTGKPAKLHRPPHGAYTLATLLGQRVAGVRGAHWSVEGGDWHPKATPQSVYNKVSRQVYPGAVVVLHDAGPGAKNTVPMLPHLLEDFKTRGYDLVPLGELDGAVPLSRQDIPRRLMKLLDSFIDRTGDIRPLGDRADNLFRIGNVRFALGKIMLKDGTPVPPGTPAVELHFNSSLLVDRGLRFFFRVAQQSFQQLALEISTRPEYKDARVIFGIGAFARHFAPFGYEIHRLQPIDRYRLQLWSRLVRRAYGNKSKAPEPKLIIMSREAFLARFGK